MLRIESQKTRPYCDGMKRRTFVQMGVAGLADFTLPNLLRARAASEVRGAQRRDTSVILLWLDGGLSHIDVYDMKPETPVEYRGYWRPIATNVSGIAINELLPLQARVADKFSIIRSLHHSGAAHFNGCHAMLIARDDPFGDGFGRYP
jgi:uncharacterized protein DUF1501